MALNCMPHPNETVVAYKFPVETGRGEIVSDGTAAFGWPIRAVSHTPNTYHGPKTDVRYWAIPIDVGVVLFATLFVVLKVERMQRSRQRVE